ncbi:HAD-IA family hydrolase, partial [Steroidobacter sp.]|uniref:HAD-IA family hydrolase n=1 Tax=Steroidobacter sp. TaxID=1978227 RepID=UPI001A36886A
VDPEAEAAAITLAEIEDVEGVCAIPGAKEFVATLPKDRWAIVTSAPRALAVRRLAAAGLTAPSVFITAEDIPTGKPDPACYRLAARTLGWSANDCLVFEDAPAGIRAGEAAEAAVVVISATHQHPMQTPHPMRANYTGLQARVEPDGRLQIGHQNQL